MAEKKTSKASTQKADLSKLEAKIDELDARIQKIERFQKVVADGYDFVANECRPLYGMSAIAAIFDAIGEKLKEIRS